MTHDPKVLIVYGSSYGQTAKIAGRIRDRLEDGGVEVTLVKGNGLPPTLQPGAFDAIAVGASVVLRGHQRYMRRFVEDHANVLSRVPSAFFSVSGSAGSQNPEEREEARRIMREFLDEAGWHPPLTASFAGAIAYTRYNPLIRWIMKRISKKEGGSTDTSRDHEYTDWDRVDAFAASLARMVSARDPAPA